jgi:hypothetical protein
MGMPLVSGQSSPGRNGGGDAREELFEVAAS